MFLVVTDASSGRTVDKVISGICDCVFVCCALKGKWLELPIPNLVDILCVAVIWHALTLTLHSYQMCCQNGYACRSDCLEFLCSVMYAVAKVFVIKIHPLSLFSGYHTVLGETT